MIACATDSAEATRRLAAQVAGVVVDGDVVVLVGDLGAGKTAFTQGFADALGVVGPVTSPTFTLVNRYEGRIVVNHVDVYRFESFEEVHDLDLPKLLDSGVTLIEWGDTIRSALPPDQLEVRIEFGSGDDERLLQILPTGPRWQARQSELRERLVEWVDNGVSP